MLQVSDQRVVPVNNVQRAIRSELDIDRAKVPVFAGNDRRFLGAPKSCTLIIDFVIQDCTFPDHVRDQPIPLHVVGKVSAGNDFTTGKGANPFFV